MWACACHSHMWRPETNFWKSVLFCHRVHPGDRFGSLGLAAGTFTNQLDHLANREPACYRKMVSVCLVFETEAHTSPSQPRIHCLAQAD